MTKTMTGIVASNKGNKTIVVTIVSHKTHPIYKKKYQVTKRIMAHDETNEAGEGDKVIIAETRPISARKHFILEKIVEKASIVHKEDESAALATVTTIETKPAVEKVKTAKATKPEVKS